MVKNKKMSKVKAEKKAKRKVSILKDKKVKAQTISSSRKPQGSSILAKIKRLFACLYRS
jgi:hypothetical protein